MVHNDMHTDEFPSFRPNSFSCFEIVSTSSDTHAAMSCVASVASSRVRVGNIVVACSKWYFGFLSILLPAPSVNWWDRTREFGSFFSWTCFELRRNEE
jgi:hypothetical protein